MDIKPNDFLALHNIELRDYATMAKGAWSIRRRIPDAPAYTEFWNDKANEWCSACTVYPSELEAFGRAILLSINNSIKS